MYLLKFHKSLNLERWSKFSLDQQLLMIANEVNRLMNGISVHRSYTDLKACFERAFELIDLTISLARPNLQKELIRWRGLFSEIYLLDEKELSQQGAYLRKLLKVLIQLNGQSALVQI